MVGFCPSTSHLPYVGSFTTLIEINENEEKKYSEYKSQDIYESNEYEFILDLGNKTKMHTKLYAFAHY